MLYCTFCKKALTARHQKLYCSNQCQKDMEYKRVITKWLEESKNGQVKIQTKNVSRHLKKYLLLTYGEKCSLCGWDKRHSVTRKVPLEVDHIDGKAQNNTHANLRLLCPNCHALTPHFRNLNKGNGRSWRVKKG